MRYTPAPSAYNTVNNYAILTSSGGTHEFLVLNSDGSFSWTTSRSAGESSANARFQSTEGIDCINGILYFVSKTQKDLFRLDLDAFTWTKTTTLSGQFNLQPDQMARVIGDDEVSSCLFNTS